MPVGNPYAIRIDSSGNLYLSSLTITLPSTSENSRIAIINSANTTLTTFAGNGASGFSGDGGAATSALVNQSRGIAIDSSGNVYIADTLNQCIRKVNTSGIISTIAGIGQSPGFSGDGGPATSAQLTNPAGLVFDSSGNLYIADSDNQCVRKVDTSGTISTFAGIGESPGFSGDGGAATSAQLYYPYGLVFDSSGNLYIADGGNSCIRKVNTSGNISTFAGTGELPGFSGDGSAATSAQLYYPRGLTFDSSGNLYIADSVNSCIRKVNTSGIISTYAGIGGSYGYSGDGGAATSAQLGGVNDVAIDLSGNLYIADYDEYVLRKVNTSGIISSVLNLTETDTSNYYYITYYNSLSDLNAGTPLMPGVNDTNFTLVSFNGINKWMTPIPGGGATLTNVGTTLTTRIYQYDVYNNVICFLEGTTILCLVDGEETYLPVEQIVSGTIVKTLENGYMTVKANASCTINNPGNSLRLEDRLYKCSRDMYPQLKKDLYITGNHSLLVDQLSKEEREKIIKSLGKIYVTEKKYRLPAFIDDRAKPWASEGVYTIWNFALNSSNRTENFGVYANGGLMVETCSIRFIEELSNMKKIQ
jgi:sugar lactone lactonase YvrE